MALEPKRNCLAPASRAPRGHSTATTFSTTTTLASSSSLSFLPWQARKERCLENRSPSIPANVLMVLCRDHLILLGISLKAIDCHSLRGSWRCICTKNTIPHNVNCHCYANKRYFADNFQPQTRAIDSVTIYIRRVKEWTAAECVYLWESSALSSSLAFCSVWKLPIE